jgi:hypothetical protein
MRFTTKKAAASFIAAAVLASSGSAALAAGTGMDMDPSAETTALESFLPRVDKPLDVSTDTASSVYNWAANDIFDMMAIGAVKGYPDKYFRPVKSVTRAEFATMVAGGLQLPGVEEGVELLDVSESFWAYGNIQKMLPYMPALTDGSFRPNTAATREDVAAGIVLACGLDKKVADPTPIDLIFKDYKTVSPDLRGLIAIAVDQKLIKGYKEWKTDGSGQYDVAITGEAAGPGGETTYNLNIKGQNFITRAEVCNLLNNARKTRPFGYKIAPATGDEE